MQFPHELGAPSISSFTESQSGTHRTTVFDAGISVRRNVRRRSSLFTVSYTLNEAEKGILERFYRLAGGDTFTIQLPGQDGDFVEHRATFSGMLSVAYSGNHFKCGFRLRTVTSPLIPYENIEQAMVDLIITNVDFHEPLHRIIHNLPGNFAQFEATQ